MKKTTVSKMPIVIVGHVDHGKSTVIGRLLADTGSLPEGKLKQVQENCARNAKPFEYAFLLDALKDEQNQGITIDSARCFFKSKKREYLIIDAPGHIEFLKNMVSGAARAEAALLVVDAKEGIQENSKRHGYLLSMLGIKQIAVCVNKMDLVDYRKDVFEKIERDYRKFLMQVNLNPRIFIPMAARLGENIMSRSKNLFWFKGPDLLSVLDSFKETPGADEKAFRMPVQAVYKFTESGDERRIVAGRIESGTISAGDQVVFFPSGKRSEIKTIEGFNVAPAKRMSAGYSAGFTLKEQIYVNRGDVMCKAGEEHPLSGSVIRANLFWMGKSPMVLGKEYKLKITTAATPVWIEKIIKVIDASSLHKKSKSIIERHDVAECILKCRYPISFDLASRNERLGRFVIVDHYDIAGGGIITAVVEDEQTKVREQVFQREQKWEFGIIDSKERAQAYGHPSKLILLTGETGIDKKSIAKQVEKKLFEKGQKVYFLGIGNLLRGLDADLEKDKAARREHVRRLGEVAHLMMDAGLIVVATASDLHADELRLLQEVTSRDAIVIINVGKDKFQNGIVDLNLNEKDSAAKNTKKVLNFLELKKLFRQLS